MKRLLSRCNITRPIAKHLVGENHTKGHRMMVGVIIILVGSTIAHIGFFFCETVGTSLHAIGFVPFIDHLEENA